jgi:hypothetical protein
LYEFVEMLSSNKLTTFYLGKNRVLQNAASMT